MVDGVLLLVDASEGPLPQTRFVLRKALEARLPVILVVNKVDRPDARIAEVVDEVYELFLDLDADEEQIEFPIVYTNAKAGWASLEPAQPRAPTSRPLLDLLLEHIPAPEYDPDHPLQAHVTNLDASPYVGRLALCRVRNGTIKQGQPVAWCRADGDDRARHRHRALRHRGPRPRRRRRGRARARSSPWPGIPEVTIGETLADPDDPRPLPVITVDEPSLSVTIGINTSPLAGRDGNEAHRPPGQGPPRPGAGRQRLDPRARHRAPRRLGGPGPRRAPARRARGAHAARGLRAHRGPAAGAHPRDRRQAARAGRAPGHRRRPRTTSASSPSCWPCARAGWSRWSTTARAGCGWSTCVPARGLIGFRTEFLTETRGHRDPAPRVRPLGAVGRARCAPARRGSLVADRRGHDRQLRPVRPPGARDAVRRAPARRSTRA